jgi:YihY family inner membrane protein
MFEESSIALEPATPAEAQNSSPAPPSPQAAPARARYRLGMFKALKTQAKPTLKYLATTEVHTYAFSVAANAILSFFPAIVLFLTITGKILRSAAMYAAVVKLAKDFLPSNQDFIVGSMQRLASHNRIQIFSLIMLLISSTGVFEPLEVALNKVWGMRKNRSYLGNQLVALGLAFGCGTLFLISAAAEAKSDQAMSSLVGNHPFILRATTYLFDWPMLKLIGLAAVISMFFLIYWVLPNGKVPARSVLPAAVVIGVLFEVSKLAYTALLPLFNFQDVYGPFYVSVSLIFWAFWVGMLLLAGAHLSAAEHLVQQDEPTPAPVSETTEPVSRTGLIAHP